MAAETSLECDVLIAGAGYVGLSTAAAIKSSAPHLQVTVVDPVPEKALENDTRAFAIAASASRMLGQLGIWDGIEPDAQAINEMIVTDSKVADVVRPVFLTFKDDRERDADTSQPFAHMVPNKSLVKQLRALADRLDVRQIYGDAVETFSCTSAKVEFLLKSGMAGTARLLIAADGVRSRLRDHVGIKTVHWPYSQKGIVVTVSHERSHDGIAQEHFLPSGPFAILPLKGNRSSLVWTESDDSADRLLAMDPFMFELELEQRFGHKLGELAVDDQPKAFPLGLTLARDYVRDRFALVGDAAHGIHPIAGQGLNLGFKDAAALAETIVEADRLGLDIGSLAVLERYQMWRRFDTVQMGVVTDVLNRLFSNDNTLLRGIRTFGLGIVDRLPVIKHQFIDQASGNDKSAPRLLQGEAI